MVYTGKWIFIRFNPDSYIDNKGNKKNTQLETRLKVLKDVIDEQIRKIEDEEKIEMIEIIKLYYDGY
jgi:predicted glycosyltransferase